MNAFTRHLLMTQGGRKRKRRSATAEKPRLGRVTTSRYDGVTYFNIKLNVPKPHRRKK